MVLILSYTSGTIELYLLVLLFGLTFVTMLFGHLHEVICRPESLDLWEGRPLYRLQAHFFGYVPQLFAWGIILAQFFKAYTHTHTHARTRTRTHTHHTTLISLTPLTHAHRALHW